MYGLRVIRPEPSATPLGPTFGWPTIRPNEARGSPRVVLNRSRSGGGWSFIIRVRSSPVQWKWIECCSCTERTFREQRFISGLRRDIGATFSTPIQSLRACRSWQMAVCCREVIAQTMIYHRRSRAPMKRTKHMESGTMFSSIGSTFIVIKGTRTITGQCSSSSVSIASLIFMVRLSYGSRRAIQDSG